MRLTDQEIDNLVIDHPTKGNYFAVYGEGQKELFRKLYTEVPTITELLNDAADAQVLAQDIDVEFTIEVLQQSHTDLIVKYLVIKGTRFEAFTDSLRYDEGHFIRVIDFEDFSRVLTENLFYDVIVLPYRNKILQIIIEKFSPSSKVEIDDEMLARNSA